MTISKPTILATAFVVMCASFTAAQAQTQTPKVRSGIPSSAELARMAQEKTAQNPGQNAQTGQPGNAGNVPQVTPVGPQKYASNEVLYSNQQVCEGGKSLPDSRYVVDLQKETVLDKQTKLMWKRCPEGVAGEYCELYAPLNPKARQQSDGHRKYAHSKVWEMRFYELGRAVERNSTFAGYTGWRVPTIEELKTLRDEHCKWPAANANAFPAGNWGTAALPGTFWTSTTQQTDSNFTMTYSMSFQEGHKFNRNYPDARQSHSAGLAVRLVRNHP